MDHRLPNIDWFVLQTGDRLTEIHLIEIVIFQLIESFNNELIHILQRYKVLEIIFTHPQ